MKAPSELRKRGSEGAFSMPGGVGPARQALTNSLDQKLR